MKGEKGGAPYFSLEKEKKGGAGYTKEEFSLGEKRRLFLSRKGKSGRGRCGFIPVCDGKKRSHAKKKDGEKKALLREERGGEGTKPSPFLV